MKRKESAEMIGRWHTAHRNTLRQQFWNAMRIEGRFGRSDLLRLVEGGNSRSVGEYLTALHRAGYLRLLRAGKGLGAGGQESRYLLWRDSGPLSPRYSKREGKVYDPNTGETISCNPNRGQGGPRPGSGPDNPAG